MLARTLSSIMSLSLATVASACSTDTRNCMLYSSAVFVSKYTWLSEEPRRFTACFPQASTSGVSLSNAAAISAKHQTRRKGTALRSLGSSDAMPASQICL